MITPPRLRRITAFSGGLVLLFKGIPERVVAEVAPDTHAAHNSIVSGVTAGVSVPGHSQNQRLFSLALQLVSVCRDTAKAKACSHWRYSWCQCAGTQPKPRLVLTGVTAGVSLPGHSQSQGLLSASEAAKVRVVSVPS